MKQRVMSCLSLAMGILLSNYLTAFAAEQPSITQGRGSTLVPQLYECTGARVAGIGSIKSSDGKQWTVPADNQFQTARKAADLYNECNRVTPQRLTEINLAKVPIIEVDADGEVITGYLLADNYFELYVNGQLIAVDAVPFTPFNSAVVRFKVKRPYTLAVKLVDWEENFGLGTEQGGGAHHPGDGGFIARFSDGTVTDTSWQAQSFYIAPLNNPTDVVESGNVHDTSKLGRTYPAAPAQAACGERCYAAHYALATDWNTRNFNDSNWPAAVEFTAGEMGIDRLPAYTRVSEAFSQARVVWSSNLVFDNLVLMRKTVR